SGWAGGKSQAFASASDWVFRGGLRGGVAVECAGGGAGELQRGADFCVGGDYGRIVEADVARRGGSGAGTGADEFLSFTGGLRAALGEHRAGGFAGLAARGQFSLHHGE